jgi:hypothetical protein
MLDPYWIVPAACAVVGFIVGVLVGVFAIA